METYFMMGKQEAPEQLFYDFRLEDHIPAAHMLRQLDEVLRFDSIRSALASYYMCLPQHVECRKDRIIRLP